MLKSRVLIVGCTQYRSRQVRTCFPFAGYTMDCYLAEYRAKVGIWAARFGGGAMNSKRGAKVPGNCRKQVITGLRMLILCSTS